MSWHSGRSTTTRSNVVVREYTGDGIGNKDTILLALVAKRITEAQARYALGLRKGELDRLLHERTEAGRVYCNTEIAARRLPRR